MNVDGNIKSSEAHKNYAPMKSDFRADMVGRNIDELIAPADTAVAKMLFKKSIETNTEQRLRTTVLYNQKARDFFIRIVPLPNGDVMALGMPTGETSTMAVEK